MRSAQGVVFGFAVTILFVCSVAVAAEESQAPEQNMGITCTPNAIDLTTPAVSRRLDEAMFTPAGPAEVVDAREHFKVSKRLFWVGGAEGLAARVTVVCRAFCADDSTPSGCNPLPSGKCSMCACSSGVVPCTCNRLVQ